MLRWLTITLLKGLLFFIGTSILVVLMLRWIDPPTSSFMLQEMLTNPEPDKPQHGIRYHWIDYRDISPNLALAVIAAEDQKFPYHMGFDLEAIQHALQHNRKGQTIRGASTITQQVAKNLFLWPSRSYLRKGLEAYFTVLVELFWPKQRILEVYLNISEMGNRLYGARAASQIFFDRPASQINREQAALLAAVLPNPKKYQVNAPSAHVRKRQKWILAQMRNLGG